MKFAYYLIITMIAPLTLYASERDSILLRAEQYYQQNEFSKAIAEYQSLAESGWISAELFYNLGNAEIHPDSASDWYSAMALENSFCW